MKKLIKITSSLALILATSITLLSCDNGNEATMLGQSVINGNVVIESSSGNGLLKERSSKLVFLKSFLSFTKPAHAQLAESIIVIAF
jgi:hypothetical protein